MKLSYILFVGLLLIQLSKSEAQVNNEFVSLKNFVPPSPESVSLGKYGDMPVSLSTGIPNIEIPVYEVTSRKNKLSLSFSYHASGIRVNEIASNVGLGWSLSGIPEISRTVIGIADEKPAGFLNISNYKNRSQLENVIYNAYDFEYLTRLSSGEWDSQSDLYSFATSTNSGKFVYDVNKEIHHFPVDSKIKIIRTTDNKFKIIDDSGVIYEYSDSSRTHRQSSVDVTTWHISRIISADKTDTISFEYISAPLYSDFSTGYTLSISFPKGTVSNGLSCSILSEDLAIPDSKVWSTYERKLLSLIRFSNGTVQFEYSNDRLDPVFDRLNNIKVYNTDNLLVKQVWLNHGYFQSEVYQANPRYSKRLRLEGVTIGGSDTLVKANYSMEYNDSLPPYVSGSEKRCVSIDHWGYYNGATTSSDVLATLIPKGLDNSIIQHVYSVGSYSTSGILSFYNSRAIDRDVNPSLTKAGIIKKLVYPTGGFTLFEFENNRKGQSLNSSDYTGGLRIKTIKDYDPVANDTIKKSYQYSIGIPKNSVLPFEFYFQKRSIYPNPYINTPCFSKSYFASSSPFGDVQYFNGASVLYEFVTEYLGDSDYNIGKTVYQFDIENDSVYAAPYLTKYWNLSTDKSWARGELLNKKIYKRENGNYVLVNEQKNTYQKYGLKIVKVGQICELTTDISFPNLLNYMNVVINDVPPYHYPFEDKYLLTYFEYADYALAFGVKKLIKSEEIDYRNNLFIKTKEFEYTSPMHLYSTKIKENSSIDGEFITTEMQYPEDYLSYAYSNPNFYNALQGMIQANMKVPVIKKRVSLANTQLFYQLTEYNNWQGQNKFYPVAVYNKNKDNPEEKIIEYLNYDDRGNILTIKKSGSQFQSFIWGYNKTLPIAIITGKEYNDAVIQSGINLGIANYSSDNSQLISELNKLHTLTNCLTKTQTYKNLIGINYQRDISGIVFRYEYDSYGRLAYLKDGNGMILKKICYNYSGGQEICGGNTTQGLYSNNLLSQIFSPTNCSQCSTPVPIEYIVPAGTYTSTVSQSAADQLALNDISQNGQQYANSNGVCSTTGALVYYNNTAFASGFYAVYTNISSGISYSFLIPSSGSGALGCLPSGTYTLNITKTNNIQNLIFSNGCFISSGLSATFGKFNSTLCNTVTIEPTFE